MDRSLICATSHSSGLRLCMQIMYEGTEYDYVFTVELDGQPSLKLPYNVAEDPWMAAHKWLEKHELSPLFLGAFVFVCVKSCLYVIA